MPDDPFAPLGSDRTVVMPAPGGRAPRVRPAPGDETEPGQPAPTASGLNPLVAAANPLLNIVSQLRASVEHPNPTGLRESLAQGIRDFEARARATGIVSEKVIAARYVLCTLIDETAATTPWGSAGQWAQQGLLVMFHNEAWGGEKVFQLLAKLAESPGANLDVLELTYVCLQLGFEGRYRIVDNGQSQLETLRGRLLSLIRKQRGEYERDLSPSWRGVANLQPTTLGWLPLWVVGAVAGVALLGVYLVFLWPLSRASDSVAEQIARLRGAPTALPPAAQPRLARFLADEIERGRVSVDDRLDRSIVTIHGDGLFRPGEAAVSAEYEPLLRRIADALSQVPGRVEVVGHTDNTPIRTLRFPSNWELSKARAQSVLTLVGRRVPTERLWLAEGRADFDPVASNSSPEGRAKNRRVEIILWVPAGAAASTAGSGRTR